MSAAPATQYGSDVCRLIVASLPSIVNRRKYVRMPVNNKCTVTFKGGADVYEGTMVNISANGFAFQTRETMQEPISLDAVCQKTVLRLVIM